MTSRTLVGITGLIVAVALCAQCARRDDRGSTQAADEAAVRQTLVDWYAAYSGTDEAHYRTFLADEYVLLENGTPMGVDDDVAMMRKRESGYSRKDAFDFQSVTLHGDLAYAVYFLESDIVDDKMRRQRRWLESAILRRVDGRWRAALLHSTKISGTDTPRS